jgi:hypothetical protein
MLDNDQSGRRYRENVENSLNLAAAFFPDEEWVCKERNIYVARSRLIEEWKEKEKWEREMSQVRILTSRGSVACFLPEKMQNREAGRRCADLVLDGSPMEIKIVSGTRTTLGGEFRLAYKQGADLLRDYPDKREHCSIYLVVIRFISRER